MPEFSSSPTLNSTSRMKSPYSFSVQRNELPVFGTVVPTISPFSTWYFALPPFWSHPSRLLPSNRFTVLPREGSSPRDEGTATNRPRIAEKRANDPNRVERRVTRHSFPGGRGERR